MEPTVAFVLFVFVGVGEDKRKDSDFLAFRDLNECVWYAQTLHKQSGRRSDNGLLSAEDGATDAEGLLMIPVPMIDLIQIGLLIAILVIVTRR